MKITINGQEKELTDQVSLQEIIRQFYQNPKHAIAEVNGSIVKSINWQETDIHEGDIVELVSFVGGG